ncbi:hypothetical protein OMK64_01700 [Cellulomonas fimi]|uniref:hypothetical protein n=1 Tax=Cellulomonas fimi TaxID=1708 RepID=UPI00234E1C81|nr:hypothetical protein [Cellulomonas fimi]MDC7120246.1 hypothetical protein [Cellulomonas fimi]
MHHRRCVIAGAAAVALTVACFAPEVTETTATQPRPEHLPAATIAPAAPPAPGESATTVAEPAEVGSRLEHLRSRANDLPVEDTWPGYARLRTTLYERLSVASAAFIAGDADAAHVALDLAHESLAVIRWQREGHPLRVWSYPLNKHGATHIADVILDAYGVRWWWGEPVGDIEGSTEPGSLFVAGRAWAIDVESPFVELMGGDLDALTGLSEDEASQYVDHLVSTVLHELAHVLIVEAGCADAGDEVSGGNLERLADATAYGLMRAPGYPWTTSAKEGYGYLASDVELARSVFGDGACTADEG